MSSNADSPFVASLSLADQQTWTAAVDKLASSIHEVDRDATPIWFQFWPMWLQDLVAAGSENPLLFEEVEFKGNGNLAEQVDSAHAFLFGHRYWPQVKTAISGRAASQDDVGDLDLADQISAVAADVAAQVKVDKSLLVGITAAGFMTLRQVGRDSFDAAPGTVHLSGWAKKRTPSRIIADRAKNDTGGVMGYLKGLRHEFTINFDEGHRTGKFKLTDGVQLTQASMRDQAQHSYANIRCVAGDGPIPTECRSAACGLCWMGVLGGGERLSPVEPLERRRLARFGYADSDEERPLIRLACQSQASGNATVVMPPWNAIAGRWLEGKKSAIGGHASSPEEENIAAPRRH